jgi:hypothetical protein
MQYQSNLVYFQSNSLKVLLGAILYPTIFLLLIFLLWIITFFAKVYVFSCKFLIFLILLREPFYLPQFFFTCDVQNWPLGVLNGSTAVSTPLFQTVTTKYYSSLRYVDFQICFVFFSLFKLKLLQNELKMNETKQMIFLIQKEWEHAQILKKYIANKSKYFECGKFINKTPRIHKGIKI